jgi:hypothetical protein
MRNLVRIALVLLISLPVVALQGPPAQGGRGGAGGPGGPGAGGGRGGARGGDAAQPAPPEDPGFECFEASQTPEFPVTALQRRIDGTAWARIALTPQGAISNLDLKVISAWGGAPALLGPPVEKIVRASKFKTTCGGKTVAVAYVFAISGEATAAPKPTRRDSGHVMYIESQPQIATSATGTSSK